MDEIKEAVLEKRKAGREIIPLSGYSFPDRQLERSRIEPGGIAQLRFRGRRIGVRIMKAAGNEFVGRLFHFEGNVKALEELSLDGFIKFHEENIFGYDPPARDLVFRKSQK